MAVPQNLPLNFRIFNPGPLDPAFSYGLLAAELGRHLYRMGHRVSFLPCGDRITPLMDDELRELAGQPIGPADVDVCLGYPTGFKHYSTTPGAVRIAITMFESSRLPAGWVEALGECDAVVTPSTFCRDVFRSCGVTVPVHRVPLGINEVYQPYQRTTDHPFTFLASVERGRRKGARTVVEAFLRAFENRQDVRLILKKRPIHRNAGILDMDYANIDVVEQDMTEAELYDLYCRCDCLVFPSAGEGFGLPPREMAVTGGISLATAWSGLADDIDRWGWRLPYTLIDADWEGEPTLEGQPLGQWAHVDVDELAKMMFYVYASRHHFAEQSYRQASEVRELYSWSRFAQEVAGLATAQQKQSRMLEAA